MGCLECQSGFAQIKTNQATVNGGSNPSSTYHCATPGRWIFDYAVCTQYDTPTYLLTSLACTATKCTGDATLASPCGTCTADQLATNGITVKVADAQNVATTNICLDNGIVDFCDVYVTGTTDAAPLGCRTCLNGYELVDTDVSRDLANGGATVDNKLRICLPSSFKDANC